MGHPVEQVYLQWMLQNMPESSPWRKAAKQQLYNVYSLLAELKCCSRRRDLQWGRRIHAKAVQSQHGSNMYIVTALTRMYAKCGRMVDARRMFDSVQNPDVVSWNVLLMGYAENGDGGTVMDLLATMKACGCMPDSVTYVAALKACTALAVNGRHQECLKLGRQLHSEIGCHMDHYVRSTLIEMYAKCRSTEDARRVFDSIQKPDVVCWTALILGHAENGQGLAALDLFSRMKASGCVPDSVTYVAALKACTSLTENRSDSGMTDRLERVKEIHTEIGCCLNPYLQSTLIDMYAKCGDMINARHVFDDIQKPDVVCWNALLLGYVENEDGLTTLKLFSRMKAACAPNSVTYIAALKACGLIGDLALGRTFHLEISEFSAPIVTCLVDFYAKSGCIVEARAVFNLHPRSRDVSTWNSLLAGYGSYNCGSVFNLFQVMQDEGFQPDDVTFICMLLYCSRAGLVEKAMGYLKAMPVRYRVTPTVVHYNCMVDLMGRANQLKEAVALILEMPYVPNAVTWLTLLGACRKWKNVEVGRWAFESLVNIDNKNASAYVLMAHIYGSRGLWGERDKVLEMRMKSLPEQSQKVFA